MRRRDPSSALATARAEPALSRSTLERFRQWLFNRQWTALEGPTPTARAIASDGDLPIFVAHDSADVWAHQGEYYLDATGNPTVVAGVPPDYFSPTGQRWGNPLYRWDVMQGGRLSSWWIERISALLRLVDFIRIDHFRGFEAYWEIPASEPTAVKGAGWPVPGAGLL